MSARHRRRPTPLPLTLDLARTLATASLAAVAGLAAWALLPTMLGWDAHVVVSGSMRPAVEVGDILISSPVPADALRPGQVVLFTDPAGTGRTIAHRVAEVDGTMLVTRGDANAVDDPAPVPTSAVLGVARLRVPALGLPGVWWLSGTWTALGLTCTLAVGSVLLVGSGSDPDEGELRPRGRRRAELPSRSDEPPGRRSVTWHPVDAPVAALR